MKYVILNKKLLYINFSEWSSEKDRGLGTSETETKNCENTCFQPKSDTIRLEVGVCESEKWSEFSKNEEGRKCAGGIAAKRSRHVKGSETSSKTRHKECSL